jgi:hypothetical protein
MMNLIAASLFLVVAATGLGGALFFLASLGAFDRAALERGQGRQALLLVSLVHLAVVLVALELALHQEGVPLGQEVEDHQHERRVHRLDGLLVHEQARHQRRHRQPQLLAAVPPHDGCEGGLQKENKVKMEEEAEAQAGLM